MKQPRKTSTHNWTVHAGETLNILMSITPGGKNSAGVENRSGDRVNVSVQ